MKITYIKMFNKNKRDEKALMKHLRDKNIKKEIKLEDSKSKSFYLGDIYKSIVEKIKRVSNNNEKIKTIFSKKLVQKNQAVLIATSLMLVTAGYLNYTNNIKMAELGDAQLVSANISSSNENDGKLEVFEDEEMIETSTNNEKNTVEGLDTTIDEGENTDEYFTNTKLERETMFSQMIESYQKILEKRDIDNEQKTVATNEIKSINERKNAISTIENLVKIKGIEDLVVLINGNSINVVVKSKDNLETTKIAQIVNIVSRELNAEIEDIHITTHE